ncbi:Cytochrome P450, E-class, group I [Parasponia andersonii]|uniref:Cytochrome P450, E-class, group I n=1 Tax=Parasponia andersonii TaxID=3476 RepID=A0A2P5BMY1_PARAD|nr:Cytochrome P450, E-class, group I [Parasponia andersonii]
MSFESCFLFIPQNGFSSLLLNFNALLCSFLLVAVFGFWLSPGGLAWALSKSRVGSYGGHARTAIPGPSGLPFLGLVFAFCNGSLTHRLLAKLAESFRARPLMAFSVGLTRFVVSSHPETAKELLNSSDFADRPVKESAYELLFNRAMGFAPYGDYWRSLRRILATHLFSPRRIASFGPFRARIGLEMVDELRILMQSNGGIEVRKVLHFGSLNNVMMSVFGKSYEFGEVGRRRRSDSGAGEGAAAEELEGLVREGYELLGVFNWSDHFPLLGFLDVQGVRKRCKKLVSRVNVFVGKIIEEHRERRVEKITGGDQIMIKGSDRSDETGDFVDVLLDLEKENILSNSDMIAVLWEMIFRGTDTVAILLEWILARMILHPEIQSKAQSEIDAVVGGTHRGVSDSDLPKLNYLQAIVRETLRLHPPGPLLSWARLSIQDTHIGQHFIPAGTTAVVNMWAITHDDRIWPEPNQFNPERFMIIKQGHGDHTSATSIMGSDLRLAPFGSGRRVCPGKAMGLATVELWLAQLLQSFKWVPANNSGVDLSETLKLSLEMKNSLVCKVIPRVS